MFLEHVEHPLGGDAAGDGGVAGGDAFGHGHEVRFDPVVLIAEPFPGAAHAADNLVDVKQDVVFAADLLHPIPVAGRGRDDAAARGDATEAAGKAGRTEGRGPGPPTARGIPCNGAHG